MKVLLISSSLLNGKPSPIIVSQANSIRDLGYTIEYYTLKEKGLKGYLKEIFNLQRFLKKNHFNIYHAHYGLSAIVATLAGASPLVVSLMGSDIKEGGWQQCLIKKFVKRRWKTTITKSQELANIVGKNYCEVIPNGVNLNLFRPLSTQSCREQLNLALDKTYILFAANPQRPEKNFNLVKDACSGLNLKQTELIYLDNIVHLEIPLWMNAADLVVLSSLWEGSPNVIKEAMACNRPIVSTNVGDVEWLFGFEPGHYIANFDQDDFTKKINEALEFSKKNKKTNGRERIVSLGIDSENVAKKIATIYQAILNENIAK